jgi:hypothetical protein
MFNNIFSHAMPYLFIFIASVEQNCFISLSNFKYCYFPTAAMITYHIQGAYNRNLTIHAPSPISKAESSREEFFLDSSSFWWLLATFGVPLM